MVYSPACFWNCESPCCRSFGSVTVTMTPHHVDAFANSNQATFVQIQIRQRLWQIKMSDIFFKRPMCWKCSRQAHYHYHGEGQCSSRCRWQVDGLFAARCSPDFLRLSFTSPLIGLVGNIWTSVQSPSIEPTMCGIRNQENHSSMFLRGSWYKCACLEDRQREPKSGN